MHTGEPHHRRQVTVHYPAGRGQILLRTELDWERDLEPGSVTDDGNTSTFVIDAPRPFVYVKPCLRTENGRTEWLVGENALMPLTAEEPMDLYPHFQGAQGGSFTDLIEIDSPILGRRHAVRVYLPPGYEENPLRRYPVFYMQDGKNLFFPEEAFAGRDWHVQESLELLDRMSAIDRVLVVGIYSADRMNEYSKPGYEAYARSVVEEVRPVISAKLRVLDTPSETGVLGSSLGGVVSFYMAWQYPDVFGRAACMSSTFGRQDDLIERVLAEPKSTVKFYLDSGWPKDNYEVTLAMAMALTQRGYRAREDFVHLVFPHAQHDERAWGSRLHLPLQLAFGKSVLARRGRHV